MRVDMRVKEQKMKEFFQSTKVKIFFSVLLVLVMLSVFTRNVENNVVSTSLNALTYGISKVTAAATHDSADNRSDNAADTR